MTKKQVAINKLEEAKKLLREAELLIITENTSGKQFDYCTSSKLSDRIDNVLSISKRIDKLVYQR